MNRVQELNNLNKMIIAYERTQLSCHRVQSFTLMFIHMARGR